MTRHIHFPSIVLQLILLTLFLESCTTLPNVAIKRFMGKELVLHRGKLRVFQKKKSCLESITLQAHSLLAILHSVFFTMGCTLRSVEGASYLKIPQLKVDNHETVATSKKGVHSYEEPQWHKKKCFCAKRHSAENVSDPAHLGICM